MVNLGKVRTLAVGDYIEIGGAIYCKKEAGHRENNAGLIIAIHDDGEQPYEVYVSDGPARGQYVRVQYDNAKFLATSRPLAVKDGSPYRTSAKPAATTELEARVSKLEDVLLDNLIEYKVMEALLKNTAEDEVEYGRQHGFVGYADVAEARLKMVREFLEVLGTFEEALL